MVHRALTNDLKEIVGKLIELFTPKLGVMPAGFHITKGSRYWGHCDIDGHLLFNWQLIFAPQQVVRYVAAHELCHLIHRDHGELFWMQVAALLPDYNSHKQWLDRDGKHLDL